ncbi:hypothetical protein Q3V23_23405 [Streptomyces sp. VNUA116]|uniref:hypothetical protein n=1 Tax=Streptomyces sp. VNUA116 TaxID=3062449 RepID=UPI0026773EF1|nr:hypothetical protein [Streptomyces sp. VNUA116]WKU46769.1 hypothetical protein Q3V23_23405 [Streptomyces sp. VNUA116]
MKTQTVTARFEVCTTITVDVEAELDVPSDIVHDDEALLDWLADNQERWVSKVNLGDAHTCHREVTDVYGTDA